MSFTSYEFDFPAALWQKQAAQVVLLLIYNIHVQANKRLLKVVIRQSSILTSQPTPVYIAIRTQAPKVGRGCCYTCATIMTSVILVYINEAGLIIHAFQNDDRSLQDHTNHFNVRELNMLQSSVFMEALSK